MAKKSPDTGQANDIQDDQEALEVSELLAKGDQRSSGTSDLLRQALDAKNHQDHGPHNSGHGGSSGAERPRGAKKSGRIERHQSRG